MLGSDLHQIVKVGADLIWDNVEAMSIITTLIFRVPVGCKVSCPLQGLEVLKEEIHSPLVQLLLQIINVFYHLHIPVLVLVTS